MERYITFENLRQESFHSTVIECHKQIWNRVNYWTGYSVTPRFADGFLLVCSDIEVTYCMDDGSELRGSRGDVFYAPKGICYTAYFKNGSPDTNVYTINFNLCDSAGNELRLGNKMQKLFSEKRPDIYRLADELSSICLGYKNNELKKQIGFLSILNVVLDRVGQDSEDYYPIRHGVELFLQEWDKNERISRYAEVCQMSESSFYQHFKAWAHMSPAEYRNNMRISAAKSMLKYSTLTIQDIASKTGFSDQFYFSRIFKKITGIPPQNYRKQ